MKKLTLFLIAVTILLTSTASFSAYTIDAPHNETNDIDCQTRHNDPVWAEQDDPGDPDNTVINRLCLRCHDASSVDPLAGPPKVLHSSKNTDTSHGTWSNQCNDCHDPHFQAQLDWAGTSDENSLYLAEGSASNAILPRQDPDYSDPQGGGNPTTTFGVDLTRFKPNWDQPALWSRAANRAPVRRLYRDRKTPRYDPRH